MRCIAAEQAVIEVLLWLGLFVDRLPGAFWSVFIYKSKESDDRK